MRTGAEFPTRQFSSIFASFQLFESVRDDRKLGQRIARRIGSGDAVANNAEWRRCSALKTGLSTKKMLVGKCVQPKRNRLRQRDQFRIRRRRAFPL